MKTLQRHGGGRDGGLMTVLERTGHARVPAHVGVGLTFVPAAVLASWTRADPTAAGGLRALCCDLDLDFAFVVAAEPDAEAAVAAVKECGAAVVWAVDGPLWPVLTGRGALEGLKATISSPASLDAALDRETDRALEVLRHGLGLGVDAIAVADDFAGAAGPVVAPDYATTALFPRLAKITDAAARAGVPSIFHSDGDVRVFLPAVHRSGFVAVHGGGGLGREAFERLYWAARQEGLTVVGGISAGDLHRGPHAGIRVGTHAGLLAHAGGLLVGDDGGIQTRDELVAFVAAVSAARGRG